MTTKMEIYANVTSRPEYTPPSSGDEEELDLFGAFNERDRGSVSSIQQEVKILPDRRKTKNQILKVWTITLKQEK